MSVKPFIKTPHVYITLFCRFLSLKMISSNSKNFVDCITDLLFQPVIQVPAPQRRNFFAFNKFLLGRKISKFAVNRLYRLKYGLHGDEHEAWWKSKTHLFTNKKTRCKTHLLWKEMKKVFWEEWGFVGQWEFKMNVAVGLDDVRGRGCGYRGKNGF